MSNVPEAVTLAICRKCGWSIELRGDALPEICGGDECGCPFFWYVRREEDEAHRITYWDRLFLKIQRIAVD